MLTEKTSPCGVTADEWRRTPLSSFCSTPSSRLCSLRPSQTPPHVLPVTVVVLRTNCTNARRAHTHTYAEQQLCLLHSQDMWFPPGGTHELWPRATRLKRPLFLSCAALLHGPFTAGMGWKQDIGNKGSQRENTVKDGLTFTQLYIHWNETRYSRRTARNASPLLAPCLERFVVVYLFKKLMWAKKKNILNIVLMNKRSVSGLHADVSITKNVSVAFLTCSVGGYFLTLFPWGLPLSPDTEG